MNTTAFFWTRMFAGLLLSVSCAVASTDPWRVAKQPELEQALEQAPVLQTESLGEPARGVNVWERWLVPNLDGKTWDVLQVYFKEYYGPTWLYVVDLGTGQVKKQRLPDGHQFYLSGRALGFDGKYYITSPASGVGTLLFVYDLATDVLEDRGVIVPRMGGECRPIAVGPDGRIVFSQLDLQRRLDRSQPSYDPVAERILLNLLDTQSRSETGKELSR